MGKRTSEGYLGIVKQDEKGTPLAPVRFVKLIAADSIEMLQEISAYRELEGDQEITNIVKNIHTPDGTFSFYARPDLVAAILAYVLGKDTRTESSAPYTHTIHHAATLPWLTIEKYLDTVERIEDCKINQVVIEGTSGQPITVEVSFYGLTSKIIASPQTPTYEANAKFMFYDGKGRYKLDSSNVITNICFFRITILRNIAPDSQTEDFLRNDLPELGFDVDVEFRLKFENSDHYLNVLYGGGTEPVAALDDGDLAIDMQYGSGSDLKQLRIEFPTLKHIAVQKFLDPEPAELEVSCVSKAIQRGAETIIVTCKNAYSVSYITYDV